MEKIYNYELGSVTTVITIQVGNEGLRPLSRQNSFKLSEKKVKNIYIFNSA